MDGGDDGVSHLSYSSGEEDGDAEWRAAISSVSNTAIQNPSSSSAAIQSSNEGERGGNEPPKLKHYQIKFQKLLEEILDNTLEIVPVDYAGIDDVKDEAANGGGIRLFKNAPLGVVFDHIDKLQGPTKRPNLIPGQEIDEKSKKFKRKLQSVVVDGADIVAASDKACQKSLAWLESKDSKTKEAAKKEEERVAELKRIRGERWLPSVARDMPAVRPIIRQATRPILRQAGIPVTRQA